MTMKHSMLAACVAVSCMASLATAVPGSSCRAIPGDSSWPSDDTWARFNNSVGGNLIRTVPIAAVCHGDSYDKAKCDALRDHWYFPETHLPHASSPMHYPAVNDSCNPFTDRDAPCTLGGHAAYTVNASSVADLQASLEFVKANNLRLVIRATGHDYLGKSSGAHALAVWTRYLNAIEIVKDFDTPSYNGPAIRLGAGAEGGSVQDFAHSHGLMVVAGNRPSVALGGGYIQGGGHGPLSSFLGLGVDQALEYDFLTSAGKLLTASPHENEDLFWALSGGGGGTYGIVLSVTIKAFPEVYTSTALLTAPRPEGSFDAIQEVATTFFQHLPSVLDAGVTVIWALLPTAFMIIPAFAPNITQSELDDLFDPTVSKLQTLDLAHEYVSTQYADFHTAFANTPQQWNVSNAHPVGRLIPRKLISDKLPELLSGITHIASQTMAVGVSYNLAPHAPSHPISVNPHLRSSIFNLVSGLPIDYNDSPGWAAAEQNLVHDIMGPIRRLAPDSGAYLHEASLLEPDWQTQFYGGNYEKLLEVKDKYDPEDVFYAPRAVGSHRWQESVDGRLCRVEKGAVSEHTEL